MVTNIKQADHTSLIETTSPQIVVDIYCRIATNDPDAATNIEKQETACRAFCEAKGLSIGNVYHEVAAGYTYRDRKYLNNLRDRYRAGTTQGVVVRSFNRLSRSIAHLLMLLQEM